MEGKFLILVGVVLSMVSVYSRTVRPLYMRKVSSRIMFSIGIILIVTGVLLKGFSLKLIAISLVATVCIEIMIACCDKRSTHKIIRRFDKVLEDIVEKYGEEKSKSVIEDLRSIFSWLFLESKPAYFNKLLCQLESITKDDNFIDEVEDKIVSKGIELHQRGY